MHIHRNKIKKKQQNAAPISWHTVSPKLHFFLSYSLACLSLLLSPSPHSLSPVVNPTVFSAAWD